MLDKHTVNTSHYLLKAAEYVSRVRLKIRGLRLLIIKYRLYLGVGLTYSMMVQSSYGEEPMKTPLDRQSSQITATSSSDLPLKIQVDVKTMLSIYKDRVINTRSTPWNSMFKTYHDFFELSASIRHLGIKNNLDFKKVHTKSRASQTSGAHQSCAW